MFDYKNVAVIYLRMFLSILAANFTAANKRLEKLVLNQVGNAYPQQLLFCANGVSATIMMRESIYYLIVSIATGEGAKEFKLGKTATISKSILNQLEVWFHKEHRQMYNESIGIITASIKRVTIKPFISEIGWIKRLCFTQNVKNISYGSQHLDQLLPTRVTVQRGITNKLQVFVDIHTDNIKGELTKFIPVHAGIMRSYYANQATDPVNKWLREVLLEHVDVNLK
ncbi:hypothetical protein AH04_27 [Erwinia phage AH04]|uniref:Uncharacterized protein n=1 Tax=Erwinia phage AH04 TaxID=2869569 RepID=A0AAE8BQ12_9CAUD|nr:hypothetical protein PQC02_gp287 [Erwinia phage AH04]QZA70514.1 hypothetical protein AH04_27 [Erwinia phage AH04]